METTLLSSWIDNLQSNVANQDKIINQVAWVTMALGFAQDFSGDTAAAARTLLEAVAMSKASGNIYLILSARLHLGTILMLQGRLKQVHRLCQELLELAEERGVLHTEMAGCLYDELGSVLCEWTGSPAACLRAHFLKNAERVNLESRDLPSSMRGFGYEV